MHSTLKQAHSALIIHIQGERNNGTVYLLVRELCPFAASSCQLWVGLVFGGEHGSLSTHRLIQVCILCLYSECIRVRSNCWNASWAAEQHLPDYNLPWLWITHFNRTYSSHCCFSGRSFSVGVRYIQALLRHSQPFGMGSMFMATSRKPSVAQMLFGIFRKTIWLFRFIAQFIVQVIFKATRCCSSLSIMVISCFYLSNIILNWIFLGFGVTKWEH